MANRLTLASTVTKSMLILNSYENNPLELQRYRKFWAWSNYLVVWVSVWLGFLKKIFQSGRNQRNFVQYKEIHKIQNNYIENVFVISMLESLIILSKSKSDVKLFSEKREEKYRPLNAWKMTFIISTFSLNSSITARRIIRLNRSFVSGINYSCMLLQENCLSFYFSLLIHFRQITF